jgi:predicted DNA-binding protein
MLFRQITIKVPASEYKIIEQVCRQTSRTKTDIIRTFIRSLEPVNEVFDEEIEENIPF